MLLHEGVIDLLPVLPSHWETGFFHGVYARGGFKPDFSWKAGMLTDLEFFQKNKEALISLIREDGDHKVSIFFRK